MPLFDSAPATSVRPSDLSAYDAIKASTFAVLCGRNNSGKSFLLRKLATDIGDGASYLGPARYQNFNTLTPFGPRQNRKEEKWKELYRHLQQKTENLDNSPLNLSQAISELPTEKREQLFKLINNLLGSNSGIEYTIFDNDMSQKYINVDGHNLSFTSSGYRLVTTLLTSLVDADYTRFLIDEPELGLSSEIQGVFADFLLNDEMRKKQFSHIESVVVATHSPIFIDRHTITNNFFVDRDGSEITIRQLSTVQDINDLQFRLLGNRFETLFLPSAVMLVEGSADHSYLKRLVKLHFPDATISIIPCSGDGRIREVLAIARQMLNGIQNSPYADRMFVVLDAVHGSGLVDKVKEMGVHPDNIVVWDNNGIEFLYPHAILEKRFGKFDTLSINDDVVSANGIEVKKGELSAYVVSELTTKTALPTEIKAKLIERFQTVLF